MVIAYPPSQALGVQQRARHGPVPGETDSFIEACWGRCFSGSKPRAVWQYTGGAASPTVGDLSRPWKKQREQLMHTGNYELAEQQSGGEEVKSEIGGRARLRCSSFPHVPPHELFPEVNRKLLEVSQHGSDRIWPLPTLHLHFLLPSYPSKLLHPPEPHVSSTGQNSLLPLSPSFSPCLTSWLILLQFGSDVTAPRKGPVVWCGFPQSPKKISHSSYHSGL